MTIDQMAFDLKPFDIIILDLKPFVQMTFHIEVFGHKVLIKLTHSSAA